MSRFDLIAMPQSHEQYRNLLQAIPPSSISFIPRDRQICQETLDELADWAHLNNFGAIANAAYWASHWGLAPGYINYTANDHVMWSCRYSFGSIFYNCDLPDLLLNEVRRRPGANQRARSQDAMFITSYGAWCAYFYSWNYLELTQPTVFQNALNDMVSLYSSDSGFRDFVQSYVPIVIPDNEQTA